MSNNNINLVSFDFDSLKADLKAFMQSNSVFRDYNFEGSNLSVLLDILSYNTQKNAFLLNMVAAESFLDSAQLRDSVVSLAKSLNYTPYSSQSPKATVSVTFTTSGINNIFGIPKGASFSGSNSNGVFSFVTDQNYFATSSNGVFTFNNIDIYEGSYINESFVVDNSTDGQRFILSNPNIDINSISVSQFIDFSYTDYTLYTSLYDVSSNTNAYFIQAAEDNKYEITFGDGIFGNPPTDKSTLLVTYRITDGSAGGGCSSFTIDSDYGTYNNGTSAITNLTTVIAASAGSDPEDIESIRFRAPKYFATQERAIIADDYITLIKDELSDSYVNF